MAAYEAGDILLVDDFNPKGADWLGALIRDGERARGDGRPIWTHSALIVSEDGDIIEALAQGVVRSHASKYAHVQTKVLSLGIPAGDPRRAFAARYALAQQGDGYGVLDFISLAFSVLLGDRWSTHTDGHPICAEVCARATESVTDHGYPFAPERMMPSDFDAALSGVPPLSRLSFLARLSLLAVTTAKAVLALAPFTRGLRP